MVHHSLRAPECPLSLVSGFSSPSHLSTPSRSCMQSISFLFFSSSPSLSAGEQHGTFPSSHRCVPPALLNPFSARCLVLYPSWAPSSLTIATSRKGRAGIFKWFGNVVPKSFLSGRSVSPRQNEQAGSVLFSSLFLFVCLFFISICSPAATLLTCSRATASSRVWS